MRHDHDRVVLLELIDEFLDALGRDGVQRRGRLVHQEYRRPCGQGTGNAEALLEDVPFPQADPAALARDAVTLAVQVNGKLRGTIETGVQASREDIEAAALAEPNVARFMDGMSVKKVIVVPGKIVNIVAG